MNFPIEKVRSATPGCHDKLFVNSAGSSLISQKVIDISKEYLDQEADIGGYDVMEARAKDFSFFYSEVAKLINATPKNIAFAISATDAYSKVLYSFNWTEKDVILTTTDDYVSNIISFLHIKRRYGSKIVFVENLENGDLDYEDLDKKLEEFQPTIFALTHIPTSSGIIHDAARAGAICSKYDSYFLLDACQSIGQIKLDVQTIKCDFLTVTGRKFLRGPRGTGFLFVADHILETQIGPLCIDLAGSVWESEDSFTFGADAKRFEYWERNYSNLLGLTQAIREINEIGIENIEKYNRLLNDTLRGNLADIKGLELFDYGSKQGNIVTFIVHGKSQKEHSQYLRENRIFGSFTRSSSALIDMKSKGHEWLIRLSPHFFNSTAEMEKIAGLLQNFK